VELAWKTFDGFDRWALPTAKVGEVELVCPSNFELVFRICTQWFNANQMIYRFILIIARFEYLQSVNQLPRCVRWVGVVLIKDLKPMWSDIATAQWCTRVACQHRNICCIFVLVIGEIKSLQLEIWKLRCSGLLQAYDLQEWCAEAVSSTYKEGQSSYGFISMRPIQVSFKQNSHRILNPLFLLDSDSSVQFPYRSRIMRLSLSGLAARYEDGECVTARNLTARC